MPSPLRGRPHDLSTNGGFTPGAGRQGAHVEEMQRRRLLLATVEVLAEEGFENASVGRICKRAGVSRRTFYELFEEREECLLLAFDATIRRIAYRVVAGYEEGSSWCERVRNALVALLEILDAEPHLARALLIETPKAGPMIAERRAQVINVLVSAVEEGRSESRRGNKPPALTGQGVVGGVLSVIHARVLEAASNCGLGSLIELTDSLMEVIVHPYLGSAAAHREIHTVRRQTSTAVPRPLMDPFKDLSIRFTYRTARVLATIAADPGASNRLVADGSGVVDEGQMSRLLTRLQSSGLIENLGNGHVKGEPNAWSLTERGEAVHVTLGGATHRS